MKEKFTFWSACLLVATLPVSPFLLSASMWALVAAAWWNTADTLQVSLREVKSWWLVLQHSFVRLFRRPELWALSLLLLCPAISFFWSDDKAYWLRSTQTRLPFLILPWAFANLPKLGARRWKSLLYFFVGVMVVLCLGVGINFLLHFDAVIEGLGRGNPVPVPRSHVRFSLMVATAIVAGTWLWRQKFCLRWGWERWVLASAVVFLFFFLHVLSVRGGLFSLYAALLFLLLRYVWMKRKWLTGAVALASLLAGLWVATQTLPSLQMRIAYMRYDWQRFTAHDDGRLYSDAVRWISLRAGWALWQENPLLGTGAGDLMDETERITAVLYPNYAQAPRLPHNQFVFAMAGTGLLGLSLTLAGLLTPVFRMRRNALFIAFQVMAFASFLIECTLESAIGVAWFLFYGLWFLTRDEAGE